MKFSQAKFLSLTPEKRAKEIAARLEEAGELIAWNNDPPITPNFLSVADHYHLYAQKAGLSLPEHRFLPSITTRDRPQSLPLLPHHILLDNIRSAHNVGSILRTAEAFALGTLLFRGLTPLPTHKQVRDTAMGAADWVPWEPFSTATSPLIALETSPDAIPIQHFSFPPKFTLLLGNEEYGVSPELLLQADAVVTIPLFGRKNSLNVANAFAIAAAYIRLV